MVATILGVVCCGLQSARAASTTFCAVYIHPGDTGPVLTLFPTDGPQLTVPLPTKLPLNLRVNAFSSDGKAIYVQNASRWSDGIRKIEFNPARQSVIPGSAGLGAIWHLTVLRPSGTILVSGISEKGGNTECGTYEIDPDAGTLRTLRAGAYPNCAGGGGAISPDGKHILSSTGEELSVIDLSTGAVEVVEGLGAGLGQRDVTWRSEVSWSPDGRWIAAILNHSRIVLIDATDTSKRKNIGAAGNGPLEWSQDSKYLLLLKSELRCATSLYFESLQVLEVATGKRQLIKSSHCEIGPGWLGWMDPETLR